VSRAKLVCLSVTVVTVPKVKKVNGAMECRGIVNRRVKPQRSCSGTSFSFMVKPRWNFLFMLMFRFLYGFNMLRPYEKTVPERLQLIYVWVMKGTEFLCGEKLQLKYFENTVITWKNYFKCYSMIGTFILNYDTWIIKLWYLSRKIIKISYLKMS